MKRLLTGIGLSILLFVRALLFVPAIASAQILVGGDGPVVYGHHHCKKRDAAMNHIATATIVDPWGVSIELTEGLGKIN